MSWWTDFWRKPESASSHLAWGFVIATLLSWCGLSTTLCLIVVWAWGVLWEVVPELSLWLAWKMGRVSRPTAKAWHARAWDVTPWFLGALFQLGSSWWIGRA